MEECELGRSLQGSDPSLVPESELLKEEDMGLVVDKDRGVERADQVRHCWNWISEEMSWKSGRRHSVEYMNLRIGVVAVISKENV